MTYHIAGIDVTRGRVQLIRERVQLQNQIESLLEEGRIKLSSVITDLFGASGRRILQSLAEGQTDPQALAGLGDKNLKCGRAALVDALTGPWKRSTGNGWANIWIERAD